MTLIIIMIGTYLVPIILLLFIGWVVLPKKSTLQDLIDKFDGLDLLPPFKVILIPVVNWIIMAIVLIYLIMHAIEPKIIRLKNIRIK